MLFQRIQGRGNPEQVYAMVYNVAGATITGNYPCVWDVSTPDGVRVSQPATATLSLIVGIAEKDILDSSYGKVQCYGYRSSAFVTNSDAQAIAAGDILIPVDAAWHLDYSGASDGKTGLIFAAEAVVTAATPAATNHKVFIRAL